VALTAQGLPQALAVLAFVIGYQQLENLYFSPKVSARALEMNPAVSFLVVLGFGAVFGPLGAFLALPVAATIQATANTYLRRHDLIESHMLRDPSRWREVDGGNGRRRGRRTT
jgi:predicted PurR-regulated permease PerM